MKVDSLPERRRPDANCVDPTHWRRSAGCGSDAEVAAIIYAASSVVSGGSINRTWAARRDFNTSIERSATARLRHVRHLDPTACNNSTSGAEGVSAPPDGWNAPPAHHHHFVPHARPLQQERERPAGPRGGRLRCPSPSAVIAAPASTSPEHCHNKPDPSRIRLSLDSALGLKLGVSSGCGSITRRAPTLSSHMCSQTHTLACLFCRRRQPTCGVKTLHQQQKAREKLGRPPRGYPPLHAARLSIHVCPASHNTRRDGHRAWSHGALG